LRVLYVAHVRRRGVDLFREVCARDCEGIVAKWAHGRYETDGCSTSWLKIKNPDYSQMVGRREVFETRRDERQRRQSDRRSPVLRLGERLVNV
jgi:ATP-dependent DNA ligase